MLCYVMECNEMLWNVMDVSCCKQHVHACAAYVSECGRYAHANSCTSSVMDFPRNWPS